MNPSLRQEFGEALAAVLDEMRQALARLADTLDAERAALESGDAAALDQAGTRKQALMQQLEQFDAERRQLAHEAAPPAALAPAWAEVVHALRDCHQRNLHNGSLANRRLQMVRNALSVLTGDDGHAGLYDRSGGLQGGGRSHVSTAA